MRPRLFVTLASLALGGLLCASVAGAAGPTLGQTAGARFPDRSFVLTLPVAARLSDRRVSVTENGRAVSRLQVVPPGRSAGARFGVVLAIDNSYSMRGRPLRAAVRAARAFVLHRGGDQPVAIVAFAGDVHVVVPFTTDAGVIDRGLRSIVPRGGGSRVLDGAARAIALIRAAHVASGSVVVLSDGGDHGSQADLSGVAADARASGARVFSVGLASRHAHFGTLNLLAASGRGEFSAATSLSDLSRIYDRLGARLANQYLLQYRSPAAPGHRVTVEVRVPAMGTARAEYTAPALAPAGRAPFHHSPLESFWGSPGAALLVAVIVAGLGGVALWIPLRPRRGPLRDRIAGFVGPLGAGGPVRADGSLPARLVAATERLLDGRDWWRQFKERMDIGRVELSPARLVLVVGCGTVTILGLAPLVFGSPGFAALAITVPLGAKAIVDHRAAKQRKLFDEQLPDNLQVIASAMRAGHSFSGAVAVVVDDAQEPTRRELQRVIADEQLGMSLDAALQGVVRRMENRNLEQVAVVAALQHETGGNTAEVLDRVTETVRARMGLKRMVRALTAQGRMSRWVLTALPCVLLVFITAVNPGYVAPLYHTMAGRSLLGLAAAMVCAGGYVIKRIVDIKV